MNKKFLVYFVLLIVFLFYLFYLFGTTKITVHFEKLEPFKHHLPVYYNGFKLGHTTKVYPDKDYKSTLVDLRIIPKNIFLPSNITAVLKRKDKKDYVELKYPKEPMVRQLRHKDVIEGSLGVNFEHFLQQQSENGGLEEIKDNLNTTIISLGQTFDAITDMVNEAHLILKDARPLIQDSIQNVNKTSKNLADSSFEIKTTLEKGHLDNTLQNLESTSSNLILTTENANSFVKGLNADSKILLNCLIKNLNIMVDNLNEIIVGIGKTLSKRFGGIRLFFGKIES